jgi:tRNA-dihydrouridine synthase
VGGVLVGRGVLRNPWILAQAADLMAGRPKRTVTERQRGEFLLEYIELLRHERVREDEGFRRTAPGAAAPDRPLDGPRHDRWVVNKIKALGAYYTKGVDGGADLRGALNTTTSIAQLRELIARFFFA